MFKAGEPWAHWRRLELDADLRDHVSLHVTHDQFYGAEARSVSDGRSASEFLLKTRRALVPHPSPLPDHRDARLRRAQ
jgi:hypothetical protein